MPPGLLALTRAPGPALAHCALTYLPRTPIDLDRAREQHQVYVTCLEALGVRVLILPAEPERPDAVFVEDTVVVLDELAVMARPGAESRRPEVASVAAALAAYRPRAYIAAPGTLDGGDVVRVGRALYVGQSTRTNTAGTQQLRELVAPVGYEVRSVAVRGCLHLKSACTYVGGHTVLVSRAHVDVRPLEGLHLLDVPALEPLGGNAVLFGETIVMAEGSPETAELLRRCGREVRTVDISEFHKAEGGVSCLSVVIPLGGDG